MRVMTAGFVLSVVFACCISSERVFAETETRIPILNAEDLALLDGGNWVLASSMRGGVQSQGGIYAIDARSGSARQIYPNGEIAKSSMKDCPAPVAATEFAPHGIALHKLAGGVMQLYVVNHGGRESIEIFSVEQNAPQLHWIGCIVVPTGAFGNAVAVADDGTVFITNMGKPIDGTKAISPLGGDVLSWSATTGWRDVPDSAIVGPNGLLVSPDGRQVYVASWPQGELIKLTRAATGTTRAVVKLPFLPDNIRWRDNGNVLASGHRDSVAAVTECFMREGRCEQSIPSSIAEVETQSFTLRCSEPIDQSMATVGIDVGDELWVGTARGEAVLRQSRTALSCR